MTHIDVLIKSLQNILPTTVNMHKLGEHFIMEIFYEGIVDAITNDLKEKGYSIVKSTEIEKE